MVALSSARGQRALSAVLGMCAGATKLDLRSGSSAAAAGKPSCDSCEGALVTKWTQDDGWCPPACFGHKYCGTCWSSGQASTDEMEEARRQVENQERKMQHRARGEAAAAAREAAETAGERRHHEAAEQHQAMREPRARERQRQRTQPWTECAERAFLLRRNREDYTRVMGLMKESVLSGAGSGASVYQDVREGV